ncbi:MAG: glycoside hydrolase family 16 protein [Mariniblastus sp.]|nr:glycoside hydrolase family 16 protein [Mariniblastus sp.]
MISILPLRIAAIYLMLCPLVSDRAIAQLASKSETAMWRLSWSDEFDGPLNERFWHHNLGPRKDSIRVRENAFTEDGHLILRTSKVDGDYQTGFVQTRRLSRLLVSQRYGYFEVRMKLNTAPGQWAAFWLMPKGAIHNKDGSGRDGAEIDIVEGFSSEPNSSVSQAIHFDGYGGPRQVSITHRHEMAGRVDNWHTYALRWCSGSYTWYVDGRETWSLKDPNAVSQVEQYLLLTSEVVLNASWAGLMDDGKLPADTLVDFVRVYEVPDLDKCQSATVPVQKQN